MSHTYDTSTYIAEGGSLPARLDSPDQLRAAANAAFSAQNASPDKLVYVTGATRSGWAVYTAKALVEAVDLPLLGFLSDQGQHKFETEHGYTCVSILDGADLPKVAADIKKLLELVRGNPMLAMDADNGGNFIDIDHVAKALARDYVSSKPAYDYGNVQGDDGQSADYFFTWLRSILRVVEGAISEGRAVIHVLVV
jgi:hypothetical protein